VYSGKLPAIDSKLAVYALHYALHYALSCLLEVKSALAKVLAGFVH